MQIMILFGVYYKIINKNFPAKYRIYFNNIKNIKNIINIIRILLILIKVKLVNFFEINYLIS